MAGSKRQRAAERRRLAQRRKRRNQGLAALGVVIVVTGLVVLWPATDSAAGSVEREAWDLPALTGEGRVALAEFSGKPTVAAFFASWCHICQRELPGFSALEDRVGTEVHFVGINTMNNGQGGDFAAQMGIADWPLARDVGGIDGRQLATNFGARGSPTTVIYDADGRVVDVTLGALTADQLAAKLDQLFGVS